MSDVELIQWLKRMAAQTTEPFTFYGLAAARLEQLTQPAERSPLTTQREAEIRDRNKSYYDGREVLDLIAALDHERRARIGVEGMMQDQQQESGLYDAGFRAGVAKVLNALELCAREDDKAGDHEGAIIIREAAAVVREHCGSAELPPHAQTYAKCQRLQAALQSIIDLLPQTDERARNIARTALEGS